MSLLYLDQCTRQKLNRNDKICLQTCLELGLQTPILVVVAYNLVQPTKIILCIIHDEKYVIFQLVVGIQGSKYV